MAKAIALLLGLSLLSGVANAKGCLKGAVIGGVAGHVVGHGVAGAVGGCITGRQLAKKKDAETKAAADKEAKHQDRPAGV